MKRDRSRCHRKNRQLEDMLKAERRAAERYKKRYQRLLKNMPSTSSSTATPSPRTRTRKLLRNWRGNIKRNEVAKTLNFHFAILADFKERYKQTKNDRAKQAARRVFSGKVIRKCKFQKLAEKQLSITTTTLDRCSTGNQGMRPVKVNPVVVACKEFFCRDDVSRMTTEKKNTITRNKIKIQRRLLSDTLRNLHRKFTSENVVNVSYAFFCKLRPFYVVEPTELDRQTCQCKIHENLQFMADVLCQKGAISSSNLEELVGGIVCDINSKECAYDECQQCKGKKHEIMTEEHVGDFIYQQWVLKKIPRQETSDATSSEMINITAKVEVNATRSELIDKFQESLHRFKKHIFNIRRQYQVYRQIKVDLGDDVCLLHIDFSENYACKYNQEIRSVHF